MTRLMILTCCGALQARAADQAQPQKASAPANQPKVDHESSNLMSPDAIPQDSHHTTALKLMGLINTDQLFMTTFEMGIKPTFDRLKQQGITQDKLIRIKKAMMDYGKSVSHDPELKRRMVAMYTDTFSEDEINALIKFYETPVGKKYFKRMTELSQKSMQLGMEIGKIISRN